ncbi:MAG: 5'-methylthioadenosine/adenosylhomocysteine nucleosidase [Prevotella sp.]|nr:5'-methylthioadenosine/adenosylhomocysteine nucleosidase [Prevotella sp.]
MKTGIIIAMDKEFSRVKALLTSTEESIVNGRRYVTGLLGDNRIVLHQCGIGKVNAAIGATEMISAFGPDAIVSTGVAGGASTALSVCDVVVARQTCYHDAYCGSEVDYGQIIGLPARFEADTRLLECACSIDCGTPVHTGLTVTGDWFVDSREKMSQILDRFPEALAVDMESAAIAHACHQRGVAFISFRIISDIPLSDHKAQQYFDFWETMADRSFHVTKTFLENIQDK